MKRNIIGGNPLRGKSSRCTTGMADYNEWKLREARKKTEGEEKSQRVKVICWDNRRYERFATEEEIRQETEKGRVTIENGLITFDFRREAK